MQLDIKKYQFKESRYAATLTDSFYIMEVWKTIEGYEGIYEVSNLGRVKSFIKYKGTKERILNQNIGTTGYYYVGLFCNKIRKIKKVHQLVAIAFLNHKPCGFKLVVNHKDFNKLNNRVDNLEITTQRENTNQKHLNSTSNFVGVSWDKTRNKWRASIRINNKKKYIGRFKTEIEASNAYQKALLAIHE